MPQAKVTFKGQVTTPKEVRNALVIKEGDSVVFAVVGDHAVLKPIRKKSLLDFYGSLPSPAYSSTSNPSFLFTSFNLSPSILPLSHCNHTLKNLLISNILPLRSS